MSAAPPSPSPADPASPPVAVKPESGASPSSSPTPPLLGAINSATVKQEPAKHEQHADMAAGRQGHAEHAELKEAGGDQLAGDIDMAVDGEGAGQEGSGSDEETIEGQRLTRSRRGNAAGLYMLDHGSQLVPKKVLCNLLICIMLTGSHGQTVVPPGYLLMSDYMQCLCTYV